MSVVPYGDSPISGPLADAAERIALWREKPHAMVEELFGAKPDPMQRKVLEEFPHTQRQAMKACKGPGKTTTLSWCGWNFLLTRPHPNIAATSVTGDNLRDGLWKEMSKWQQKAPLLIDAFTLQNKRIFQKEFEKTWFMSARTWPKSATREEQANTLAGLHAEYIAFLIDESGSIPTGVLAAADAGLATEGTEGHLMQAGNPTETGGALYDACTNGLWTVYEITGDPDDPMRSPRVALAWARELIAKYGRDDPWVMVNVLGKFPPTAINSLIGPDEVRAAMRRHMDESAYAHAAKVLGVDVARFGLDASCIARRQGQVVLPFEKLRGANSLVGAGRVATVWNEWKANACFIDNTGGFGSGWIDQLQVLGRAPVGIHFAMKSNSSRYLNKRAEMAFLAKEWIDAGGCLPYDEELVQELTAETYTFSGDKLQLVDKDMVKALIGRSPDKGDSLKLTFAQPVHVEAVGIEALRALTQQAGHALTEYDPHARA